MDIAVFQYRWGTENPDSIEPAWARLAQCSWVVLLWPGKVLSAQVVEKLPNEVERLDPWRCDPDRPLRTVELLRFSSVEEDNWQTKKGEHHVTRIYLARTGLIRSYVPV